MRTCIWDADRSFWGPCCFGRPAFRGIILQDAARDKQEERAQQAFLEAEANKTFAPIEGFLIRLSKVLSAAGALMEIDTTWEHLGERRLRRVAKVTSSDSLHRLPLDFTINAASTFYRNKVYRFAGGVETLIHAVTAGERVKEPMTEGASTARGSWGTGGQYAKGPHV